jgi:threonine aldolase
MIDFRSDTVTRPTAAMREAMSRAEVGDDVFGDDPTVNRLQQSAADMLGFEAALYAPSGTQTNLIALMSQCQRGDEAIVGQMWHTYRWEGGGMAVLGSIQPQPVENQPDGSMRVADIAAAIKPDDPHFARTRLIGLENTTGGKVLPLAYLAQVRDLARSHGLAMHLDGARLFNAAVETARQLAHYKTVGADLPDEAGPAGDRTGELPSKASRQGSVSLPQPGRPSRDEIIAAARAICSHFDTVSVCLSKGLGAPVGSLVLGSAPTIERARRVRKMLGGGMRQAGIIAAAGLHALEHHLERLADDHANAKQLAQGLRRIADSSGPLQGKLSVSDPATNILFVDVDPQVGDALQSHLERSGVAVTGGSYHGGLRQRWVTHLDVDAKDVQQALEIVAGFAG